MGRINHHVAIITAIVMAFHKTTNSASFIWFLMVDIDIIRFNKRGNCSVILESLILS
jgi:hypothetical protein